MIEETRLKELIPLLKEFEFSSFSVGISFAKNDEEKKEITEKLIQEIGKKFPAKLDKQDPELIVFFDCLSQRFSFQIMPVFILGCYNKFSRELPQTIYYCFKCKGRGCNECGMTGRKSSESIQELIESIMLKEFNTNEGKFHGAGREDVDVLMLGSGREFAEEIVQPKKRSIDLKKIEKEINKKFGKKFKVTLQGYCSKEKIAELKAEKNPKKYRAVIEFESEAKEKIDSSIVQKIKKFSGKKLEVIQKTPERKLPSKNDAERKKWIELIKVKQVKNAKNKIELTLNCESGTYVKEFISGDENRTIPSIASIIGKKCKCIELDVMEISQQFGAIQQSKAND